MGRKTLFVKDKALVNLDICFFHEYSLFIDGMTKIVLRNYFLSAIFWPTGQVNH